MDKISICIPAYKRINYLLRLLNSITIQSYKNFEVILTDDSPDETVKDILKDYKALNIQYYKNEKPLGTPANWNVAISMATGQWIKLMHDDDWFSSKDSLQIFADHAIANHYFVFCAYTNVFENAIRKTQSIFMPWAWRKKIIKEPGVLLAHNVIGPPSVTLIHSSIKEKYDESLKWRVDMEFYMRILQKQKNFTYIDKTLINVGVSESQVTQSCIYNPNVELPEGYILLKKHGTAQLKNILVYDAWWRLLRNMNIKTKKQLYQYEPEKWPELIIKLVYHLSKVPNRLLKIGAFSKAFMTASWLINFSSKE